MKRTSGGAHHQKNIAASGEIDDREGAVSRNRSSSGAKHVPQLSHSVGVFSCNRYEGAR